MARTKTTANIKLHNISCISGSQFQVLEELISDISTKNQLIAHYGKPVDGACDLVKVFFMKNSWQLTAIGAKCLINVCESYRSTNPRNSIVNGKVLLNLSKIIEHPWYILGQTVFVWKQPVWFELQMFDGDVHRYVEFREK